MATTTATTVGTTTTTATTAPTTTQGAAPKSDAYAVRYWSRHVRIYRAEARHWLTVIRTQPPQGTTRSLAGQSLDQLHRLSHLWYRRAKQDFTRAHHPPFFTTWLCIHRYEGSWSDHGAPYWGGLQMDYSFQESYGGWLLRTKGTADHWTSLEQIWVAVRAWRARGFSPWPNTAVWCGA